jgi:AcrR family transcriptional regulator
MTRKTSNIDKKLLEHGYKLLIENGASKLSIRDVCDAAEVNLGMFNYYFGSKNKFIEQILSNIYEEFFSNFQLLETESTLGTLELQLTLMAKFARDNRHLILILLNDILNGEKIVQDFAKRKMRKHFIVLVKTLKSCQKSGEIINIPLPLLITHIAGSIGLSTLIPEVLSNMKVNAIFKLGISAVTKTLMTDQAIEQRVKITLQGIKG